MIEVGTGKSRGVMTNRAILSRESMIAWLDGRYCSWISVTRCTVVYDTSMIEHRIRKSAGNVADTAVLCGRDVADILLGRRPRSAISMT